MSIVNIDGDVWLNATIEAVSDFVINGLEEPEAYVSVLDYSKIENSNIAGSYLTLSTKCNKIEIGLIVDHESLKKITMKMLCLSTDEMINKEQMSEALKEVTNIISGGIKSRLNDQVTGGIILGLPLFLENTKEARRNATLLRYIAVNDLSICISISIYS